MKTLTLAFAAAALSATSAFAATDIRSLDTDGDRFTSFAETDAALPGFTRSDFRTVDANRDNRLSSVELQSADAQAVFNRYNGANFVDLAAVDTDGDNFVSFSELADAYPGLSANDWRAIAGLDGTRVSANALYELETQIILDQSTGVSEFVALDNVDTDGSRFATFGELSASYPGLSAIDFNEIDANNDNRISFNELIDIESRTVLGRAQR